MHTNCGAKGSRIYRTYNIGFLLGWRHTNSTWQFLYNVAKFPKQMRWSLMHYDVPVFMHRNAPYASNRQPTTMMSNAMASIPPPSRLIPWKEASPAIPHLVFTPFTVQSQVSELEYWTFVMSRQLQQLNEMYLSHFIHTGIFCRFEFQQVILVSVSHGY